MIIAVPLVLILTLLLICSAALSMTEAAFLAINKVRLRHLMQRGSSSAALVYHMLTKLDQLITTLLICNTVVNVTISVLGAIVMVQWYGPERGPWIATGVIAVGLLVIGEIPPKIFAAAHADRVALTVVWPISWLVRAMRPLVWAFASLSQGIIRVLGGQRLPRSPLVTEEELKVMIEMGREAGVIAERELQMLHKIFEFSDSLVSDVMIPREDIAAVDLNAGAAEALDVLIEEGHSRIPVYEESLDRIRGVVYARDLLAMVRHQQLFVLSDLIRPAAVVQPAKRLAELLSDFQRDQTQIAIVQDAQQRTVGLVTIEDLLEEIVGDIGERASNEEPGTRG